MPTYDYRCQGCGHEFELFQSITAPVQRKCPSCGKLRLERLVGTGAGVIFKGGGFYETDYRSEAYRKAAENERKAATEKSGDKAVSTGSDSGEKPKKAEAGAGAGAEGGKGGERRSAGARPASGASPPKTGGASSSKTRSKAASKRR